jgi:alanine dehydrogenase
MVRVLPDAAVAEVLDLAALLDVVADAFRAQRDGDVERPERPHFPVGTGIDGDEPLGTGLAMPAYVHGDDHYATKLASVHEGNADRGLPTVQAQIAVTEAATGRPAAYLAGTRVTNARTGCIGGLAARALADPPVRLGIVGAGTQARWQARAVAAATDVDRIRVYSPSDSRYDCAEELREELGVEAAAADSPRAAVEDATVVVTATTATEPVFPGEALSPGAVVVAVGAYTPEMRELDGTTLDRAAVVYADVPGEAAEVGDLPGLAAGDLRPFADALDGPRPALDGPDGDGASGGGDVVVVESVGTAVLDAATAEHLLARARAEGVGRDVEL